MKRLSILLVVIAITVSMYMWPSRVVQKTSAIKQPPFVAKTAASSLSNNPPMLTTQPTNGKTANNFRRDFAESHDYWSYAHKILPAAKAGNPDAQFYLWKMMDYCAQANVGYFQRDGKALSLDEALQFAAQRQSPIDAVQVIFDRCHGFQEQGATELGKARDWLAKATELEQPAAQATTAQKMVVQELLREYRKVGAAPGDITNGQQYGEDLNSHDLMRAAVQSGDPEALFAIAWTHGIGQPADSDGSIYRLAWMYVACQRGYDCSAEADWVKFGCFNCDASSPESLMQIVAGDSWPDVQQRAKDISAKLNARQWDQLGLGS